MCEKRTLKYNTEITNEFRLKYRSSEEKPWPFSTMSPFLPPPLFTENNMCMASKTWTGVRWGLLAGTVFGLKKAVYENRFKPPVKTTVTVPQVAEIFLKYGTPFVIAGGVFGLATSASANYRKKDDFINYMIGGAASGSALGMWFTTTRNTFLLALIGAGLAGCRQYCEDENLYPGGSVIYPHTFNYYRKSWFTEPMDVEGDPKSERHVHNHLPNRA